MDVLDSVLAPIRERRLEHARDMETVKDIVQAGTLRGQEVAAQTMDAARKAMQLDYCRD